MSEHKIHDRAIPRIARRLRTIADAALPASPWDGSHYSSGLFFVGERYRVLFLCHLCDYMHVRKLWDAFSVEVLREHAPIKHPDGHSLWWWSSVIFRDEGKAKLATEARQAALRGFADWLESRYE